MWQVVEHKDVVKTCRKLPPWILKNYQTWLQVIATDGPEKLRSIPGLRDEALKGGREGQRSSRLSGQYRVIYSVHHDVVTVYVVEITPHKY